MALHRLLWFFFFFPSLVSREQGINLVFVSTHVRLMKDGLLDFREGRAANQGLIHRPRVSPNLLLWQDNEGILEQLRNQPISAGKYWKRTTAMQTGSFQEKINGHLQYCQTLINTRANIDSHASRSRLLRCDPMSRTSVLFREFVSDFFFSSGNLFYII